MLELGLGLGLDIFFDMNSILRVTVTVRVMVLAMPYFNYFKVRSPASLSTVQTLRSIWDYPRMRVLYYSHAVGVTVMQ